MKNKKTTIILVTLLIMSAIGIVSASNTNSITINTTVNVIGTPSPVNETSISGYVLNNTDKTGLSNWNIQLFGTSGQGINLKIINKQVTSNSNGLYKFDNLQEGRYTLMLQLKPGYVPVGTTSLQINLGTNQKSENNNFTVVTIRSYIPWVINTPPPFPYPVPTPNITIPPLPYQIPQYNHSISIYDYINQLLTSIGLRRV